jgi:hypothetical protein
LAKLRPASRVIQTQAVILEPPRHRVALVVTSIPSVKSLPVPVAISTKPLIPAVPAAAAILAVKIMAAKITGPELPAAISLPRSLRPQEATSPAIHPQATMLVLSVAILAGAGRLLTQAAAPPALISAAEEAATVGAGEVAEAISADKKPCRGNNKMWD